MDSPFDVLAVDASADDEEIEAAYRERVMEAHPDQGGSLEEFQAVRTAYEKVKAGYRPDTGDMENESDGAVANGAAPEDVSTTVSYLNYDVLSDFGWTTDDEDLFEKASSAGLDERDYGQFDVEPGESLLEGAESRGFAWPFACRGGACANCAILLREGELSMPVNHVLPAELMEQDIRLSCNAMPITSELEIIYNVKHMPELEDLLLPPRPFNQAYSDD